MPERTVNTLSGRRGNIRNLVYFFFGFRTSSAVSWGAKNAAVTALIPPFTCFRLDVKLTFMKDKRAFAESVNP